MSSTPSLRPIAAQNLVARFLLIQMAFDVVCDILKSHMELGPFHYNEAILPAVEIVEIRRFGHNAIIISLFVTLDNIDGSCLSSTCEMK